MASRRTTRAAALGAIVALQAASCGDQGFEGKIIVRTDGVVEVALQAHDSACHSTSSLIFGNDGCRSGPGDDDPSGEPGDDCGCVAHAALHFDDGVLASDDPSDVYTIDMGGRFGPGVEFDVVVVGCGGELTVPVRIPDLPAPTEAMIEPGDDTTIRWSPANDADAACVFASYGLGTSLCCGADDGETTVSDQPLHYTLYRGWRLGVVERSNSVVEVWLARRTAGSGDW